MKKIYVQVMIAIVLMVAVVGNGWAELPGVINYQGRLLDGTNLVNGTKTFYVKIYDAVTGGNLVYSQTNSSVVVSDGLYTMEIGDKTSYALLSVLYDNATNFTSGSSLFMELQVDSQILIPREEIKSAPYAQVAFTLAGTINSNNLDFSSVYDWAIASRSIDFYHIKTNVIYGAHLMDDAILARHLADDSVEGHHIKNYSITTDDIAGQTITFANMASNSVWSAQIGDGGVASVDIAPGAITATHISASAVTGSKVAVDTIASSHIIDGAILGIDLADSAVVVAKIADGAVNSAKISNGSILTEDIMNLQITSNLVNWGTMPSGLQDGDDVGITSESDTLQDVVNRGNTTSNAVTFGGTGTNVMLGSFQAGGDRLIEVSDRGFAVIDATTTNTEFIVEQYAAGQWRIDAKGNPITNAVYYGDGSGLTNITAQSYTETDPVYGAAAASSITSAGSGVVISSAERTKLGGIEAGADITDASNVDAAGAVMNSDIGTSVQAYDADLADLADGTLSKSKVADSANWDTAYGWGAHGTNGYLTAETDPNAVLADGSRAMTGNLNMGGKSITNAAFVGDGSGLTNITVTLPNHWTDNVIWVATNGTAAGPGTVDAPYNNPQQGYMSAATIYPASPATVVICAGDYTNGIMMIAGNVHIQGIARPKIPLINVQSVANPVILDGKMRVQGIVFKDDLKSTMVAQPGGGVKFVNCRFSQGITVAGNDVEFHHCQARSPLEPDGFIPNAAMAIGDLFGAICKNIMIVNTSIEWWRSDANGQAALLILDHVRDLEVASCEIVSHNALTPAIWDQQPIPLAEPPLNAALHLYTHNYIKRSAVEGGTAAVVASAPHTMAFHQNTMTGNLGSSAFQQYFSNNMIYGAINWALATGTWAADSANNTTYTGGEVTPSLPDPWND